MSYVDGFVIPVPTEKLAEYRKMARMAGKLWREHGALEYMEYVADDVKPGKQTSFPKSVKLKPDEVVIFSYIVYKSRADRNRVNKLVMADPRVEKVVLHVESGGGNGNGLFRTSNFIERMGKEKEFTTFTGSVMGSAAYWLGVNSPRVVAEPLASVGSIGVFAVMTSHTKLMERIGIESKVIRAGEFKALGHPDEPISEKAIAEWQRAIDESYGAFLDHTSSKRQQNRETFRATAAEGREFSGVEALKVNLVDEIMVFDDMIEAMLSAMSKTVPSPGSGRNLKMDEGAMNKKMLALLQKAGVTLTDEQMSALASGASFESIGIEAGLAAQLTAAQAEGDDDDNEDGSGDGAKTQEQLDAEAASAAAAWHGCFGRPD